MLQNSVLKITSAAAVLIAIAIILVACGGSSTPKISPAQAQAISSELFTALGSALVAGFTPVSGATRGPHSLAEAIPSRPALQSSDCTSTSTGQSCNIPISFQGNCPQGGTIAVSGDFMFTLDNSGNGSDSSTLTVTPSNCAVSNITFNGNPSVTVSTAFTLQNNALAYPLTFSETGGITFGPKPSGSCSINVNVTANSPTSCSATGSVCGNPVKGSC
jgi:hypothetical protein